MTPGVMVLKQKTMQGWVKKVWVGNVHTWTGGMEGFYCIYFWECFVLRVHLLV